MILNAIGAVLGAFGVGVMVGRRAKRGNPVRLGRRGAFEATPPEPEDTLVSEGNQASAPGLHGRARPRGKGRKRASARAPRP